MTDSNPASFNLASFSLEGMRLPWPMPWPDVFGRAAPLLIEIGFGGGSFLIDLAQRQPVANVVGVERAHHSITDTERRVIKCALRNVRLIRMDAVAMLAYLCEPASIDTLYINFPDPFPKKAHTHRRLLNPFTLALIATRLKTGALLSIATDVPAYAESIAHDLANTAGLINRHPTAWLTALADRHTTRYERKAQELGDTNHYFEWERSTAEVPPISLTSVPAQIHVVEEKAMPNVVLETPLTLDAILESFSMREYERGATHVRWLGIYRNYTLSGLLIDAFINEPLLEQRLGIAIVPQHDSQHAATGRYVVRLDPLGYPRPTRGTHSAIKMAADWISSLHPETKIVYSHINEE